ncbi:hypothetical protein RND81_11G174500 [Saponaria officinalis]|uniref:Uncharacterized protein n=1 Tax=Saponaria officinalis TaxID=3572 RepID=A0AAW1HQ06_SAPOF
MRKMETIEDLIEEAKIRFLWWGLCIFALTYFLSHTSKSMLLNVPIAILMALLLRYLANEVEFRWKVSGNGRRGYLEKKQISVNDARLSTIPPPPKWRSKFDSPVVEAAVEDFVDKIIQDFVTDLWYSDITPDKQAPDLMRSVILEALAEVAVRVKQVNLVDLLTRDIVDLIGDHIELFRQTQASIGVDVMVTLSSEERDERLKHHLMSSNALHPALFSSESEYKFLQRVMAGLLGVVLRPREAQCPLVRCIAREFVTCLVVQPIMNLVSPAYINQLVEIVLLQVKEFLAGSDGDDHLSKADHERPVTEASIESGESTVVRHKNTSNQETDMPLAGKGDQRKLALDVSQATSSNVYHSDSMQPKVADWARVLDAATQRRTEVLAPENLENMWAIGRHYKDKINKSAKGHAHLEPDRKMMVEHLSRSSITDHLKDDKNKKLRISHHAEKDYAFSTSIINQLGESDIILADGNSSRLKRSSSTSDLKVQPEEKPSIGESKGVLISEDFYSPDFGRVNAFPGLNDVPKSVMNAQGLPSPKLRCRVIGAYFEKIGSKSFAVYSIAVSDSQNSTWFVKRRYRNFERLHRLLKDIPNYNLHLPPKRIFSSSTEDAFVHQRCVQLDKYLQDLLSIANVAEQHEVWDFLSASSKNYSFGKSASVMKTLAVNVDDAVDDIVRQFKGVSDGLVRKVVGTSSHHGSVTSVPAENLYLNEFDLKMDTSLDASMGTSMSVSDNEESNESHDLVANSAVNVNGWHSDNELKSKSFPTRVMRQTEDATLSCSEKSKPLKTKSDLIGTSSWPANSYPIDDPVGVPPEWTPPNVSVPVLNLVDKVFQLNRRGWIRRQVFWISKQILQIVMEDAVDDWLLMQINWLRREDVVAEGIHWVKDILWPDGKFFLKLAITGGGLDEMDSKSFQATPRAAKNKSLESGSFEMELEAIRRASYVKKMLFNGAPAPLVSLVGQKQYKRCAQDIYYFLQSSVCLKQVAYAALELLLVSVFPELKDLVTDIHQKMQTQPV